MNLEWHSFCAVVINIYTYVLSPLFCKHISHWSIPVGIWLWQEQLHLHDSMHVLHNLLHCCVYTVYCVLVIHMCRDTPIQNTVTKLIIKWIGYCSVMWPINMEYSLITVVTKFNVSTANPGLMLPYSCLQWDEQILNLGKIKKKVSKSVLLYFFLGSGFDYTHFLWP